MEGRGFPFLWSDNSDRNDVKRCLNPALIDHVNQLEQDSHEQRLVQVLDRTEKFYNGSWSLPDRNHAKYCVSMDGFYDLLSSLSFSTHNMRTLRTKVDAEPMQKAKSKGKKKNEPSLKVSKSPVSVTTCQSPILDESKISNPIDYTSMVATEKEEELEEILHNPLPQNTCLVTDTHDDLESAPWTDVIYQRKLSDIEKVKSTQDHELSAVIMRILSKTLVSNTSEIRIHPRVSSWFISAEQGLEYRISQMQSENISQEDMIHRHMFPPAILAVARSNIYGKKTTSFKYPSVSTYKSILFIDRKKHILEISIDDQGTLFHLYAKPVRNLHDYFDNIGRIYASRSTLVESNQPTLPSQQDLSLFKVLESGNLSFDFHNKSYELVNLVLDLTV